MMNDDTNALVFDSFKNELSVRTRNALRNAGIITVGDVVNWDNLDALRQFKGVGDAAIKELEVLRRTLHGGPPEEEQAIDLNELRQWNVCQRIHGVMNEIGMVAKLGQMEHRAGGYKYVRWDDMIQVIRPYLLKYRLILQQTIVSHEFDIVEGFTRHGPGMLSKVQVNLWFCNIDNPEDRVLSIAWGYGLDRQDKSIGAAHSYACKYALLKGLCLASGDDEEIRQELPAAGSAQRPVAPMQPAAPDAPAAPAPQPAAATAPPESDAELKASAISAICEWTGCSVDDWGTIATIFQKLEKTRDANGRFSIDDWRSVRQYVRACIEAEIPAREALATPD